MKKWFAWIWPKKRDGDPPISNWPIWFSAILFFFNIEIVVTPYILSGLLNMAGQELRLSAGIWSTVEMGWWIYFSIWLAKKKMKNIGKSRIKDVFKFNPDDCLPVLKIKNFFRKHVVENFDLENYKGDKIFRAFSEFLRGYGYFANCMLMFVFSLVPGYWVVALMVSRITKWFSLYAVLLVGNFIKNYFFAYFYELVGFWGLTASIILLGLATSFIIKRVFRQLGQKL